MVYLAIAGVMCFIALLMLLLGLRLLFSVHWILGWLRGTIGLLALSVSIFLTWAALDVTDYDELGYNEALATVRFKENQPNQFQVTFSETQGVSHYLHLAGSQWQVTIYGLMTNATLQNFGIPAGFKFVKIEGVDGQQPTSQKMLTESRYGLDIWHVLQRFSWLFPQVSAKAFVSSLHPAKADALYRISMTLKGVEVKELSGGVKDNATNAQEELNAATKEQTAEVEEREGEAETVSPDTDQATGPE
ncbi:hypothetical protein KCM76_05050 [Zooshikella marina]|uniref:hypothetical protein n=1 Tax=Zooshikella ganghwensis TaxID=202772 RepID=UPI0004280F2F|nr:hypothetical protein [Zooshikella ganghwensis]MBU2705336.1 hypothetical protein [Zooshikella ganghwensis]